MIAKFCMYLHFFEISSDVFLRALLILNFVAVPERDQCRINGHQCYALRARALCRHVPHLRSAYHRRRRHLCRDIRGLALQLRDIPK